MSVLKNYSILLIIVVIINGCVRELDLEQADNVQIEPVLEISLIYFNLNEESILDELNITEIPSIEDFDEDFISQLPSTIQISDTTDIEIFDDTFINENLVEADILFQFTNSTALTYIANIQFLSVSDELLYDTTININYGSLNNPSVIEQIDNFTNEDLNNITNTAKVVVDILIDVNPNFVLEPVGELIFNSSGTFYFIIGEK